MIDRWRIRIEASALEIARNGADVVIAGRNIEALGSTISKSEVPGKISAKEADVTDRSSLDELFDWFDKEIGTLDILIHAAGQMWHSDQCKSLVRRNGSSDSNKLTGSYNVMRPTLERMRLKKKGLIILINLSQEKDPFRWEYNASKFGMTGLAWAWRRKKIMELYNQPLSRRSQHSHTE